MGEVQQVMGSRELAALLGKSQRTAQRHIRSGWCDAGLMPRPPRGHYRLDIAALRDRLVELVKQRQVDDDGD